MKSLKSIIFQKSMIFSTNSELLRPKRSTKPNKSRGRGSFAIPEKFPNHFTLVLRWTLLTVEKENYEQIYDNFKDTVNHHNDLMEEVPDDEASELYIDLVVT